MKTKIYVLFDNLGLELNPRTFNAPNDNVAKRIIQNSLAENAEMKRNAKDFDLICLGEFDTENGIKGYENEYIKICNCSECLENKKNGPKAE